MAGENGSDGDRFSEFVGGWGESVQRTWEALPEATRGRLTRALDQLPWDLKSWRGLMDQAVANVRLAAGDKRKIAIVGPANSGKSTLYNLLIRRDAPRAQVGAVPGTTREARAGEAGLFTVVDTPGADAIGAVGEAERERAMQAAREADVLLVLFDATHGIRAPEKALYNTLSAMERPMVVALNKIDLVSPGERPAVIGRAAGGLGLGSDKILPLSAKHGTGIEAVLLAIAKSEPGIVAALAEALPAYRWSLAQAVVGRSASAAAAIAVTPLPIIDFIPLVGVQAAMVLGIARIYQYKLTVARARELVATFGMALLGRTLFYELSKFGGPPGWVVAAAVAAGTTAALGYAAAVWFERGEKLSRDSLARLSRTLGEAVVERLKNFGRRRPGRATLRERIREALEDMPSPEDATQNVPPG